MRLLWSSLGEAGVHHVMPNFLLNRSFVHLFCRKLRLWWQKSPAPRSWSCSRLTVSHSKPKAAVRDTWLRWILRLILFKHPASTERTSLESSRLSQERTRLMYTLQLPLASYFIHCIIAATIPLSFSERDKWNLKCSENFKAGRFVLWLMQLSSSLWLWHK